MKSKIKQLAITIGIANALAFTATAQEVTFSPIISAGGSGSASNKASNVWLTVDDSLSMGNMEFLYYYQAGDTASRNNLLNNCTTRSCRYPQVNSIQYGYVAYDPTFPYEDNIPVDHLGNQLPLPRNTSLTYRLGDYWGQTYSRSHVGLDYFTYTTAMDVFAYYAVRNMGVQFKKAYLNPANRNSMSFLSPTTPLPTVPISETIVPGGWSDSLGNFIATDERSCSNIPDAQKLRCQVWKTYYSTRMLATKSALSLAMYKYKDVDFRLGYTELLKGGDDNEAADPWRFHSKFDVPRIDKNSVDNWAGHNIYDTPSIQRSQLFPLKDNNDASRLSFYQWLFTLMPNNSGTQTRETVSYLFKTIKENAVSKNGKPGGIWLEDTTKKYDAKDNPAYTCRLNHNIIFTDGAWNVTPDSTVKKYMSEFNQATTSSRSITLPDKNKYQSGQDYAKIYQAWPLLSPHGAYYTKKGKKQFMKGLIGIADIAFQGWITDLDDNPNNNKEGQDGALILKNTQQQKYIDKDGNLKIYKNNTSDYWQHFNDPAAWQHINTHTIGFNLKAKGIDHKALAINPPASKEEAKALDFMPNASNGNTVGLSPLQAGNADPNGADKPWLRAANYEYHSRLTANDIYRARSAQISDMGRAAVTGRGLAFNAKGAGEVIEAFDRIFASIKVAGEAEPTVSGSSGASGNSQRLDNSYFASRYHGDSFTGELLKYKLFSGDTADLASCFNEVPSPKPVAGEKCDKALWNAAKLLTADNRNIITAKRENNSYEVVKFAKDNISNADKARLYSGFPTTLAKTEDGLETLFNYVKGDDANEGISFRNRNDIEFEDGTKGRNILGSIMRSSPVYVGIPNSYLLHLNTSKPTYKNYTSYLKNYIKDNKKGQKEVIYVGSNDGMLHAFRSNEDPDNPALKAGEELFAYVPNAVYDQLGQTVVPNKQLSLVDGNIDVQMVNFGEQWYRTLAGTMAGGAKGVYALNVTEPDADEIVQQTKANWEYSSLDSDNIGNIVAKPAIIQLNDDTWAVVVGNGYQSKNNKAALVVINLETGEKIQELVLDKATLSPDAAFNYTNDSVANGLGPLYFYSNPNKLRKDSNQFDRAYAGDLQGNLWVFDLSNSSANGGIKVINNKPLFTAKKTVAGTEVRQPITVTPRVVKHPLGYGYVVHFGTGSLFSINDLSSKRPNSIYAIWDDWVESDKGGLPRATPRSATVADHELYDVKLKQINYGNLTIRHLAEKPASQPTFEWKLRDTDNNGSRGWKVDLLSGERAWQSASTIFGSDNTQAISYNTVRYTNTSDATQCGEADTKVESWRLTFNTEDASQAIPNDGVLDLNADGHIDKDDKVVLDSSGDDEVALIATGLATLGKILYNPTTQNIHPGAKSNTGGGTDTGNGNDDDDDNDDNNNNATTAGSCRKSRQITTDSQGNMIGITVDRCSRLSSWQQLR